MDAATLVELLQLGEDTYAQFVQLLNKKLQTHNFRDVLKALSPAVCRQGQQAHAAVAYVMQCLLYCQQHVGDLSAALKHLLLELLPPEAAKAAGEQTRGIAVQLFTVYCTPQDAKLATKVASIFQLTRQELSDWQQLIHAVREMLTSQSSYKAAVHLLMHFEGLDEAVDKAEVIAQLVADGQDSLAQQWVAALGREHQVLFVEACVAQDRLKPAARAVRALGLAAEFPDIESQYRQRSLARLVGKRLWQVALSFVGSDVSLQTQLVCDMADMGELALAHEYRKQLNLPQSVLTVDPAAVAAQEAARRQQYMQLQLPPAALLFVNDEATLQQAAQMLAGSDVIGLDVEWKASHEAGEASPAAVLQLATREAAVLLDLLALATQHAAALDACLAPLFESPVVLKLGFGLAGDLAKLAGSWPDVQAFREVAGVLDLRPLWVAYGVASRQQGGSVRLLSNVGLSSLCSALLGKPLDKSQQMSDWTARPLSQRQTHYAALDAFVLPQLYDKLRAELGQQRSQQLLKQHTSSVRRGAPPAAAAAAPAAAAPRTAAQEQAAAAGVATASPMEAAGVGTAAAPQPPTSGLAPTCNNNSTNSSSSGSMGELPSTAGLAALGGSSSGVAGSAVSSRSSSANWGRACNSIVNTSGQARVRALLQRCGLEGAFRQLHASRTPGCVPSIADTAAVVSAPRAAVAKTMALLAEHSPLLVVTRGDQRVDMHKLAALLGVKKRAVRMAPDSVVKEVTGFPSGGIPPIRHDSSIRVLLDSRLQHAAAAADSSPSCDTQQQHQQQQQQQQWLQHEGASRPAGGGWAAVAAAATAAELHTDSCGTRLGTHAAPGSLERAESSDESEGASATAANRCCGGASAGAAGVAAGGAGSRLFLQCGPDAVLQLSFEQLLQLSGGDVADVADMPADTPAAFNIATSTAQDEAAGQQQQQQLNPSVHPQQNPAQTVPRFLVDSMLGRLCRWLRALGVDADFVETGGKQQLQAARAEGQPLLLQSLGQQQQGQLIGAIHRAAVSEGRLFLTRDAKLAARRDVGGSVYLLHTDDAAEQLTEVSRHFGIRFDESTAMSRCSACNAAAFEQITRATAAALVPPQVMAVVQEFWQCGSCGKVFWMGPKSQAAIDLLSSLFSEGKTVPTPLQSWRQLEARSAHQPAFGTQGPV